MALQGQASFIVICTTRCHHLGRREDLKPVIPSEAQRSEVRFQELRWSPSDSRNRRIGFWLRPQAGLYKSLQGVADLRASALPKRRPG